MPKSTPQQQHKKRKLELPSSEVTHTSPLIKKLEENLHHSIATGSSLNPVADLLEETTKQQDSAITHQGTWALYRIFTKLIDSKQLFGKVENDLDATLIAELRTVKSWLIKRFDQYCDFLTRLLQNNEQSLRTAALQILMSLLKHASSALSIGSQQPQLYMNLWRRMMFTLLKYPLSDRPISSVENNHSVDHETCQTFVETWLEKYDDIRWFFLRSLTSILVSEDSDHSLALNALSFLELIRKLPIDESSLSSFWIPEMSQKPDSPANEPDDFLESDLHDDDWRVAFEEDDKSDKTALTSVAQHQRVHRLSTLQCVHSLSSHRSQFTSCWLTLLPLLQGSEEASARVLTILPGAIIPHLTRPILLHDWVSGCVDFGGPVGLLALNALFILMHQHHLDYPSFYTRLYSFFTRDVLHLKYRSRFFRLVETFLSSTHLPAKLVASFVKRLSRLSLSAPPSALITIMPFTYNLLKQHPSLMVLIHRPISADVIEGLDPFDNDEANPNLTNAIDSSLWELVSHRHHYHPTVATMARLFEDKFTKQHYGLEDFLDHTYSTLFVSEVKRKLKGEPSFAMELQAGLFPTPGFSSDQQEMGSDIISELWTFS